MSFCVWSASASEPEIEERAEWRSRDDEARMTQEKWRQLRQRLLKTVGRNNFTTWIEPLEFASLEDGVALFNVPTTFLGNYVSQNFSDLILYELNSSGEKVQRLSFHVPANVASAPVRAAAKAPAQRLQHGRKGLEHGWVPGWVLRTRKGPLPGLFR